MGRLLCLIYTTTVTQKACVRVGKTALEPGTHVWRTAGPATMPVVEPLPMIPGPTPLSAAVRAALAEPVRSHTSAENAASMRRIADGVRACVGSTAARVYTFAGSGTL